MRAITAKLGTMRKAVEWTVYPAGQDATSITIQSDTRIAKIDLASRKALLSAAKSNGAYFVHLHPALGATVVDVPQDVIEAALAAQPQSGDAVGPGVYVA